MLGEETVKVVVIGSKVSWATETHLARAFTACGCEVMHCELRDFERLSLTGVDLVVSGALDGLQGVLYGLPCVTACVNLDLWAPLPRGRDLDLAADYVFCADGGDPAWWKSKGLNHIWLRPGVVADECYLDPNVDNCEDVIFVGSIGYHPEWPHRGQLLNWARETYGERFRVYGNRPVRGAALNRLYASAKVVIGDSFCPGAAGSFPERHGVDYTRYWSDRVYETLGRGGVLVHPFVDGMQDEFSDMEHLLYYEYGDFGGLKEKIDFLLSHTLVREHIRHTGHERVKSRCTYTHRVAWLLDYLAEREPSIRQVHEPTRSVDPTSGGAR